MEHAETERTERSGITADLSIVCGQVEDTTMAKGALIEINGVLYRKSSCSNSSQLCVGVAYKDNDVLVVNTNTQDLVLRFTREEWRAFIAGVKANEFDD